MLQPQVADNLLINTLNAMKVSGRVLDRYNINDNVTRKSLESDISKLRGVSIASYYGLSSSLAALCGDAPTARSMLTNMQAVSGVESRWLLHVIQSLCILGLHSEAHQAFSTIFSNFSAESASTKLRLATSAYSVEYLSGYVNYLDKCSLAGLETGVLEMVKGFVAAAAAFSVPEASVRRMLDAAGRAFLSNGKIIQSTKFAHEGDSLYIFVSVNGSSEEAAKIEWDYTGEVLDEYPDAPFDKVSIIVESIKAEASEE